MKEWSDSVLENFRVRFALDTQILSYLSDKTYPNLEKVCSYFATSPFSEVVTSSFALYEFIGIRKREHYLRKVLAASNPNGLGGAVNISSLLNYKNTFSSPELTYDQVVNDVVQAVADDMSKIKNMGVDIDNNHFHEKLFKPSKDLHLHSRISKEDCLVAIATILPRIDYQEDFICLLTNDKDYSNFYYETNYKELIEAKFKENNLEMPLIQHISDFQSINLTEKNHKESSIYIACQNFFKKLIIKKNKNLYLGKIFNDNCGRKIVCIQFDDGCNVSIPQNPYLTIINKDLKFIYHIKSSIQEFRNKDGESVSSYPIKKSSEPSGKLSFMFPSLKDDDLFKGKEQDILSEIKKTGNLVFLHPDSVSM